MKAIFVSMAFAFLMSGCALLAAPAVGDVGTLAGETVPGVSGLFGTESTVEVNKSWIKGNDIQEHFTKQELKNLQRASAKAKSERDTTIGILESMARTDNDPEIDDLLMWVKRGGDPQYALNSAFARDHDDASRAETVRMLEDLSERDDNPRLYDLARWVRAGGDEQFALNYALSQSSKSTAITPGPQR